MTRRLGGELSAPTRERFVGSNLNSDMARTMRILAADVGLPADDPRLAVEGQRLLARIRELFAAGLPWMPGARDALAAVRAAGAPSALVTNTPRDLVDVALRGIGPDRFAVVVCGDVVCGDVVCGDVLCGDVVSRPTPDPEPYRRAAELLGVDPGACVAVEDSATGARAVEAVGAVVLAVPNDAPVPAGPRRVHRASLVGVTWAELAGPAARAA